MESEHTPHTPRLGSPPVPAIEIYWRMLHKMDIKAIIGYIKDIMIERAALPGMWRGNCCPNLCVNSESLSLIIEET